jgi:hypothetical protein
LRVGESEAIQRSSGSTRFLDCFVASLLAMTARVGFSPNSANRVPSLRAKRSNPERVQLGEIPGLLRRFAPRNDGAGRHLAELRQPCFVIASEAKQSRTRATWRNSWFASSLRSSQWRGQMIDS